MHKKSNSWSPIQLTINVEKIPKKVIKMSIKMQLSMLSEIVPLSCFMSVGIFPVKLFEFKYK